MSSDLDPFLKRLHLANARRVWRDLVQRAEKEDWSYEQLLYTLFTEEVAHRRGTRLTRAVRAAAFPFLRTIDEFDFTYQSTLRLTTIGSLLTPDFITEGRSVIFEGKPGRGKTHLAIAIAYRAMQNGFEALFTTAAELIDDLSAASRDGRLRDALAAYMRPHVLVCDEVGYLAYGDDAANVLYHVVNDRHIRRRAMIFTTNKHPKRWGHVLHDEDLGEAIVDRILERGRLLRLDGPSVRTKHLTDDELRDDDQPPQEPARISGKHRPEFPERNPNVLECLWTPLVEHATPLAREMLAMRDAFLSKLVYQTYNGYVLSQFKKLEQDVRTKGDVRWKHVMHLVRLLLAGVALLRDGTVVVRVEQHRERLIAVRDGRVAWQEIDAWRLDLHHELDAAYETTRLPERPDYETVNRFPIRARRAALDDGGAA